MNMISDLELSKRVKNRLLWAKIYYTYQLAEHIRNNGGHISIYGFGPKAEDEVRRVIPELFEEVE